MGGHRPPGGLRRLRARRAFRGPGRTGRQVSGRSHTDSSHGICAICRSPRDKGLHACLEDDRHLASRLAAELALRLALQLAVRLASELASALASELALQLALRLALLLALQLALRIAAHFFSMRSTFSYVRTRRPIGKSIFVAGIEYPC